MVHVSAVSVFMCCIASSVIGQYVQIQNGGLRQFLQNRMFSRQQPQMQQFPSASRNLKMMLLDSGMQRSRHLMPYTTTVNTAQAALPRNIGRNTQRDRLSLSYPAYLRSVSQIPRSGIQTFQPLVQQQEPQSNVMRNPIQYYASPSRGKNPFTTMYPKQEAHQIDQNSSANRRQSSIISDYQSHASSPKLSSFPIVSGFPTETNSRQSSKLASSPMFSGFATETNSRQSISYPERVTRILNSQTKHPLISSRTQPDPHVASGNRLVPGTLGQNVNTMPIPRTNSGLVRFTSPVPSARPSSNTIDSVGSRLQYGQSYGQSRLADAIAQLYMYPRLQQLLYVKSRRQNLILPSAKSRSVNAQNAVNSLNFGAQQMLGVKPMSLGSLYVQHQLSNNVFPGNTMFGPQVGTMVNPSMLMPTGGIVSKVSGGETEVISADGRVGKLEGGRLTFERYV